MKHTILIITLILVSIFLAGCPKNGDTKPDQQTAVQIVEASGIDRASTGNKNRRTWVIWKTDTPDVIHIKIGDGLRIEKDSGKIYLKPLSSLRKRWGQEDNVDFRVELTKIGNADPVLCGKVDIPNHDDGKPETHILRIVQSGQGTSNNNLMIEYELPDPDLLFEQQCARRNTHGGRAHGEH